MEGGGREHQQRPSFLMSGSSIEVQHYWADIDVTRVTLIIIITHSCGTTVITSASKGAPKEKPFQFQAARGSTWQRLVSGPKHSVAGLTASVARTLSECRSLQLLQQRLYCSARLVKPAARNWILPCGPAWCRSYRRLRPHLSQLQGHGLRWAFFRT